jgi:processive 1,2-diacylglycerol beta-glucosyltransferase
MAALKKVLIFYITERSGHHSAARAMAVAFGRLSPETQVICINAFRYLFPVAERITHKVYMSVIKRFPRLWEKMYDNPKFVGRTQGLQRWIYRRAVLKMKRLIESERPQAVIATQAFPCGVVAAYKKETGSDLYLAATLTDFAPHAYWVHDEVNLYSVASDESRELLVHRGADPKNVRVYGIPIDPRFSEPTDRREILANYGLSDTVPIVMVMGGGHGLGPIRNVLRRLDAADISLQFIVVCGINRKLYRWVRGVSWRHKVRIFRYTSEIDHLMSVASVLITKPGGITTAEALAKNVPMIIMSPIPGQEARNTRWLVRHGVAVEVHSADEVVSSVIHNIVTSRRRHGIFSILESTARLARPRSSAEIVQHVLERRT